MTPNSTFFVRTRTARRWPLALLAVTLAAAQGCKKEESAAPPPAAPPAAATPSASPAGGATNAAAATTNAPAGDSVDLRLKWPVGKRYLQRMETTQEIESTVAGMPAAKRQETAQSQDYSITVVKEREDGGRELELEFIGQRLDSRTDGKPLMMFDSKSDTKGDRTNVVAAAFRKLVGLKLVYWTDTNGAIQKVVGAQEVQKRLVTGPPSQANNILTSLLNEENLKRVVVLTRGLPDRPVKIGDTWSAQQETPMGKAGTNITEMTYTFKGWEEHDKRRCALLEFTGTVTNKPSTAPDALGVTIENGKAAGKVWFDPAIGMVVDSFNQQENTMKFSVGGQTVENKMRSKVGVKILEITDVAK